MNNIILHIPHSSLILPKKFWENVIAQKKTVENFNIDIADTFTEELFGTNNFERVVAPYSRIFCDVEKFVEDSAEVMSQFGMGVIYTKTNKGEKFFNCTDEYKHNVIENYYNILHTKLDEIVEKSLSKKNQTILIDCHSFSKDIIMLQENKKNLPDICIGCDEKRYYNQNLISFIHNYFIEHEFKVALNYPYSGAMIPDKFFNSKQKNLHCFMIEINKSLYLDEKHNKNSNFENIKKLINQLLQEIESLNI